MEMICGSSEEGFGHVRVRQPGDVGQARRMCRRLAEARGLGLELIERTALVATELANNLAAHAREGELYVLLDDGVIDLLGIDRGPGFGDVARAFRDGYSSAGTSGTGLGAMRRLSDAFDFDSGDGGTVILCRLAESGHPRLVRQHACLVAPHPGEVVSGDGVFLGGTSRRLVAAVVDGLGHGRLASTERAKAIGALRDASEAESATELLRRMHDATDKAGGAAGSVAVIEPGARRLTFAGIGNVAGRLLRPEGRPSQLVSVGGILGREPFRPREQVVGWHPGALLVIHSDGLTTRWVSARYPWIRRRDPALLAGILMRDFRRARDDASVLVVREAA